MTAAFNADAFMSAAFTPRTETILVEPLRPFFGGDEPEFTVRGLTAAELQRAMDVEQRKGSIDGVIKAIASQKEQVEAIRKTLGLSGDIPGETAKRIELLVLGAVKPTVTHAVAVKIAEIAPIEFISMTSKITILTGQGADLGKPETSSQTAPA